MSAATESVISEMVDRLVRRFDPLKIVLFGSHARGDADRYSDVDLLVVLPEVDDERATAAAMRDALRDVGVPNDVWPTDPATIALSGDKVGAFLYPVLREGRVIYGVDDRDAGTWLRYAEEDLTTAERMVRSEGFALRWACYLSQQAAEKAIKAVLVAEEIQFPYIHRLHDLRDLVPRGRQVAGVAGDLEGLSRWAAGGKYPGLPDDAGPDDASRCLELARQIVEAASKDVHGEG